MKETYLEIFYCYFIFQISLVVLKLIGLLNIFWMFVFIPTLLLFVITLLFILYIWFAFNVRLEKIEEGTTPKEGMLFKKTGTILVIVSLLGIFISYFIFDEIITVIFFMLSGLGLYYLVVGENFY